MRWLAILLLSAMPALAQQQATSASGGTIRVLDKITGETTDITVSRGEMKLFGRLKIVLGDCRFPTNNPNSDAYGWLEIRDSSMEQAAFSGWMIASSPALSAMEHPRYDVWLLRCNNN
ncbi:DUF2155 domain-containing protein [Aliiruegeria sabulilitoris]|uniref:DUF2155 domain-containing protein n=1 Tax=Aliiruegeria sabulilitoris TaxID=1510458 RepID=UPI00082E7FF4|nr:DUF2155 domain-containing protein [Aliiruegeria sabulilitoris]NDR55769.1 DUF2155 domain-containing protein [Pseudoruegeria sp. M32A2M]